MFWGALGVFAILVFEFAQPQEIKRFSCAMNIYTQIYINCLQRSLFSPPTSREICIQTYYQLETSAIKPARTIASDDNMLLYGQRSDQPNLLPTLTSSRNLVSMSSSAYHRYLIYLPRIIRIRCFSRLQQILQNKLDLSKTRRFSSAQESDESATKQKI